MMQYKQSVFNKSLKIISPSISESFSSIAKKAVYHPKVKVGWQWEMNYILPNVSFRLIFLFPLKYE